MFTLEKLAECVDGEIVGDKLCVITRVATLQNAGVGDISFLANRKYVQYLKSSNADAVIVSHDDSAAVPKNAILVADPYVAYAKIAQLLNPAIPIRGIVEASAVVHKDAQVSDSAYIADHVVVAAGAKIAAGCHIGPGCIIAQDVTIARDVRLICNVSILENSRIGERVILHPGVVIGSDGFGLANDQGKWLKIPQVGRVIIGDDVEIGANTTIDCGAIDDTRIEEGVKLDNLIQIGHNVTIGAHTVIASSTAVAGSTKIGQYCAIGGKVGIVGHIEIVDKVQIMGMAQVTQSITKAGTYASGTPTQPVREWHRNYARYKQLDQLARRIKKLESN